VARDCDQHFRDTKTSSYNEPSKSFGCATSANIVQHVSDKSVFVNPAISDVPSARGAVSAMQRMNAPRQGTQERYTVTDPLSSSAGTR
jgi:type IV pilus biogenesis protein CpaD/CtpE